MSTDRCQLNILGGFALRDGRGRDLPLPTRKDRLLLSHLAFNANVPQPREKLCGLLWADRSEEQARGSLRQSLAALRQAFADAGVEPVSSGRTTVTLDPACIDVDALAFERLAKSPGGADDAIAFYRGELLSGLDAPTSESGAWLAVERRRLADLAARLVENRSRSAQAPDDAAIGLARRLLLQDRLLEPVYCALMRMLWRRRERAEALRVYAECRKVLAGELGVPPELETEQLYRDILTDRGAAVAVAPDAAAADARPSIAVMPFANIGKAPELDVLCEGLAEDVIIGLGRFRLLFVIDRNSSLAVSRVTNDCAEIGKRLGAELVVTGSLRRLGEQARVAVQLVKASSRVQVWGDTFDCAMADLLAVPETIARSIVVALHAHVETVLEEQSRRKPALAAYECLLRGVGHLRGYGPDDNQAAIELFDQAIALDPGYALAYAYRAFSDVVLHGYNIAPATVLTRARDMGQRAVEMEPDNARSHWLLGMTCSYCGDTAAEDRHNRKALSLNPNDANVLAAVGSRLAECGQPEAGLERMREAMRLNPHHPEWYWLELGDLFYLAARFEDAIEAYRHLSHPTIWVLARFAACHAMLGRSDETRDAAARVLQVQPDFKLPAERKQYFGGHDIARFRDGMSRAGLSP